MEQEQPGTGEDDLLALANTIPTSNGMQVPPYLASGLMLQVTSADGQPNKRGEQEREADATQAFGSFNHSLLPLSHILCTLTHTPILHRQCNVWQAHFFSSAVDN